MVHPAPRALQCTSQVVNGPQPILQFSHFQWPFCDVAKLTKKSANTQSTRDTFLAGTAFHMDLGFIRGPKIIKDENGQSKTTKTTTAQLSHGGYSAYLIIFDAATRYVFCFPLESRSPPMITQIDRFISKNGQVHGNFIRTSPNSLLHKSTSFKDTCKKYGYAKTAHQLLDGPYEDLLNMGLERLRYYIRTDNGTKLAGSQDFCQMAANHNFIVETTAPNASSENGLGEQPHCTLKEKVRCLLFYTAGLSIEFWSNPPRRLVIQPDIPLFNRTQPI
jgi:hypothetical protein